MKKNRELVKQIIALVLLIAVSFIITTIVVGRKFTSKAESLKKALRDADKKEKFLQERNLEIPDIAEVKQAYQKALADIEAVKKIVSRQHQQQKSTRHKKSFVNIHSPKDIQKHIGKILALLEKQNIAIKKLSHLHNSNRPLLNFELSSQFVNFSSFINELDAMRHRVIISKLDIQKSPEETQLLVNLEITF